MERNTAADDGRLDDAAVVGDSVSPPDYDPEALDREQREIAYEVVRQEVEELGHRARMLEARLPLPKVEADLAATLRDVSSYIRRFVVFKDDRYADVIALWVMHTWCFDASDSTPYLWITSPAQGSGKTRVLEVLEVLARRPWRVVEPTEAVTFRKIQAGRPTLLLDEIDVIFSRDRRGDSQAGLRGIMNAGYRRGAVVPRAEEFGRKLVDYNIYCPKAFAGIGKNLPDTVVDRSIKIPLTRKRADEKVERFAFRSQILETERLRDRLRAAAERAEPFLREWREWVPEEFMLSSDRHAEVWEPLFAIAEAAGDVWPQRARELAHWTCEERAKDVPATILLLQHVQREFDESGEEFIPTQTLLARLGMRDDGPWGSWWEFGSHADVINLTGKLKEFDVKPDQGQAPDGANVRGYRRRDFVDAWKRYLPRDV